MKGGIVFLSVEKADAFSCAVIISKKVAALATTRNRLRRRVRETLRRISFTAQQPFRCAVAVRKSDIQEGKPLETVLVELLRESGILNP